MPPPAGTHRNLVLAGLLVAVATRRHNAPMGASNVTQLLQEWRAGDKGALEALTPLVHGELKRLAARQFRGERANHTLQPTALVNEAYLRLVDASIDWQDRAHFFALAARMMRRILATHAEARNAEKRGGGQPAVTLNEELVPSPSSDARLLDLDAAITRLAALDPRQAELVELNVFAGLTFAEMAKVTGLSTSTIDRELRFAKVWLKRELSR
ncbi:MAG: sigma-70 family RNA polymerase sigma factor [Pseudomonadota bacterium]